MEAFSPEFIERANRLAAEQFGAKICNFPHGCHNDKERQKRAKYLKKYYRTEKGRLAVKNNNKMRRDIWKGIPHDELEQIRRFYRECPIGMTVDHIIPLKKGGEHRISNLQYLTPEENASKGCK